MLENFRIALTQFRLVDFADLILVWMVVYRVLLFIRGTGAVQMLAGLGIVSIAYILSIWGELYTLNWLLEKFFSNLFVIVVILFQAEIRRALALIGRNPFFTGVSELQETQVVEEIVKGAVAMAQKGYGALIVLEREMGLENLLEMGTELDATVTSELLQSIFIPTSPLHDGASIVRNGRLVMAGCFLPLTKNPGIDKNLGTRHRAAIGLTEESDALVVVVSEEQNQIGIALAGQFTADVDMNILRKTLYAAFGLRYESQKVQAL